MKKETLDRASKITELIEENKKAIEILESKKDEEHIILWYKYPSSYCCTEKMEFEPWEIRLIIYNKKQRIKALEKELEEL